MEQKKFVIVELNDGSRVEGILTDVNKVNFTIHISEANRYKEVNGNTVHDTASPKEIDISKTEIKEVKLVQYDQLVQTAQQIEKPVLQVQVTEKSINQSPFGSLPVNQKLEKVKYEKKDFFDGLGALSNKETIKETIKDNEKNSETFNLPQREYNNQNYRGGNNRGRGNSRYQNNYRNRYNNNEHGYQNNYNNYNNNNYNNNSNYDNSLNKNNQRNYDNSYKNYNNQGQYYKNNNYNNNQRFNNNQYNNNNNHYNNNFSQRGNNNRGRRNFRGNNGGRFFNNNNNINDNFIDKDDNVEERGKSIYDQI